MSSKAGDYSFCKLINDICTKPHMFVMMGTFLETSEYLEGFARGIAVADPSLGTEWVVGPSLASEWVDFSRKWLPQRLRFPRNFVWWSVLWKRYPDDQTALEKLRLLFLEYKAEESSQEEA